MTNYENNNDNTFQQLILRYVSFWPYFLISIIISLALAFIYLRYAKYEYNSFSKIEIIDKAQDSDMSLPTSMTIFNRSMMHPDTSHLHQLIFFFIKKKFKLDTIYSNILAANVINFYNLLVFSFGFFFIHHSKIQIMLILLNLVIYTVIYLKAFTFKVQKK